MTLFRFYFFLFGAVLGWPDSLAAQAEAERLLLSTDEASNITVKAYTAALRYPLLYPAPSPQLLAREPEVGGIQAPSLSSILRQQAMPEAFFCKLELKIDKAANMNCRFRLGSVDYVDYLEGKRRSY